ncbi:MAG: hypothetical protein JWO69_46 [Thermoleophilia bacterium]|jgi:hypothetical protein|nr:hypothetical protein [Thermoleophilia bacterium]
MNVSATSIAIPRYQPLSMREIAWGWSNGAILASEKGLEAAKAHDFELASELMGNSVNAARDGVELLLGTTEIWKSPHYDAADRYVNAMQLAAREVTGLRELVRSGSPLPDAFRDHAIADAEKWVGEAKGFRTKLFVDTKPVA